MKKPEKRVSDRSSQRPSVRPVTSAELGRYLRHLALIARDARLGNKSLSVALSELADFLIGKNGGLPADAIRDFRLSAEKAGALDEALLREMEAGAVRKFLADEAHTKADLIQLGGVRFGIARSRLQRMQRVEIIEVISAALKHEESLGIISSEAKRGGGDRSS